MHVDSIAHSSPSPSPFDRMGGHIPCNRARRVFLASCMIQTRIFALHAMSREESGFFYCSVFGALPLPCLLTPFHWAIVTMTAAAYAATQTRSSTSDSWTLPYSAWRPPHYWGLWCRDFVIVFLCFPFFPLLPCLPSGSEIRFLGGWGRSTASLIDVYKLNLLGRRSMTAIVVPPTREPSLTALHGPSAALLFICFCPPSRRGASAAYWL